MILQTFTDVFPIIYRAVLIEINICVLGVILSVFTLKKYFQNRQDSLFYLFQVFISAILAVFFSICTKTLYLYFEVAFLPDDLPFMWFIGRLANYRISFIFISLSAYFAYLFGNKLYKNNEEQDNSKLKRTLHLVYLIFVCLVYIFLFDFRSYLFDAICFLLLSIHMIMGNLPIAVKSFRFNKKKNPNLHIKSFRFIGLMSVSFMFINIFLLIDRIYIILGSYGYTVFYYFAWFAILIGICFAYYGFIRKMTIEIYQSTIKSMPLPAMIFDKNYNILDWNDAASEIFGWKRLEVLNTNPIDYMVSEDQRRDVQMLIENMMESHIHVPFFHQALTKDGREILCKWENTPLLNASGEIMGILSIVNDVTEQQQLRDQIKKTQRLEAIGQLSSGVAHDFNNILTAILGFARLSKMKLPNDSPVDEYIDEIEKAGMRAEKIVKQLLTFSRKQVINPRIYDMNKIIRELHGSLLQLISEDIEIRLELNDSLPNIEADKHQIEQILINLVVNARDAIDELRNEEKDLKKKEIVIRTSHNSNKGDELLPDIENKGNDTKVRTYIEINVKDSGIGMDPDTVQKIFEPFFTTKEVGKGTGLGLSTVHGIVMQNDGYIKVHSQVREGTEITIFWPVVQSKDKIQEVDDKEEYLAITNIDILFVEDDSAIRELVSHSLSDIGFEIFTAEDGSQALQLGKEVLQNIDLVITDVVMPNMNGRELVETLKNINPWFDVIFTSGYPRSIIDKSGIVNEDVNFLKKPYTILELLEYIKKIAVPLTKCKEEKEIHRLKDVFT